jgi:thiamine monophosphate kinase
MKELCRQFGIDLHQKILAGGEDYVLLFTLSPGECDLLCREVPDMYSVGEIVTGNKLEILSGGCPMDISQEGFDHFERG